ncbi:MAG: hypothetical protein ACI9N1_001635 [Flavobacteriales bacterium]
MYRSHIFVIFDIINFVYENTYIYTYTIFAFFLTAQNPACGFNLSKTITIDGGQVSGTVADFPVLISHTDTDLNTASAKVTSASGFDIIFSDDIKAT